MFSSKYKHNRLLITVQCHLGIYGRADVEYLVNGGVHVLNDRASVNVNAIELGIPLVYVCEHGVCHHGDDDVHVRPFHVHGYGYVLPSLAT